METITVVLDAHVHIYDTYDLSRVLKTVPSRMVEDARKTDQSLKPRFVVWMLTEWGDCHVFDQLKNVVRDFRVEPASEHTGKWIRIPDGPDILAVAGRQIVSAEGLEILALGTDSVIANRTQSTDALIRTVSGLGAVPVVNWAPGKWWGGRGRVVRDVIRNTEDTTSFALGDTAMRVRAWRRPKLMREAMKRGVRVLNGSDPLPLDGEELRIGEYAQAGQIEFDEAKPVTSVKRALLDSMTAWQTTGTRNSFSTFVWRESRIMLAK